MEDVKEETTQEEESQTEESSTEEEKTVPYERFKEVIDDRNELKSQLESIGTDIKTLKEQKSQTGLTQEQQAELNAKQTLSRLIREQIDAIKTEESAKTAKEQIEFEKQVTSEITLNPTVKKAEFLKFLEDEGDNFSSVKSAMSVYLKLQNVSKTSAEKAVKEIASKPSLPSNEGKGTEVRPESDNLKSIHQLAEEFKKGL